MPAQAAAVKGTIHEKLVRLGLSVVNRRDFRLGLQYYPSTTLILHPRTAVGSIPFPVLGCTLVCGVGWI